jgi:hypothetical protein
MKMKQIISIALVSIMLTGCSHIPKSHVSGSEFQKIYNQNRPFAAHWRYEGEKRDRHYMSFYAIPLGLSVGKKEKTIWTHSDELPAIFPIEGQKPINTGMNPEVIDSMLIK